MVTSERVAHAWRKIDIFGERKKRFLMSFDLKENALNTSKKDICILMGAQLFLSYMEHYLPWSMKGFFFNFNCLFSLSRQEPLCHSQPRNRILPGPPAPGAQLPDLTNQKENFLTQSLFNILQLSSNCPFTLLYLS